MLSQTRNGSRDMAGSLPRQFLNPGKISPEKTVLRTVKCPNCKYPLLEVYGFKHYYIRVKCQKCKFSEAIDTALFRKVRR